MNFPVFQVLDFIKYDYAFAVSWIIWKVFNEILKRNSGINWRINTGIKYRLRIGPAVYCFVY